MWKEVYIHTYIGFPTMNIYESFFYNNMLRFSNDNFVPLKSLTWFAQGGTHKML